MKNTTITLEETTLEEARKMAREMGFSFNAWINKLVNEAINKPSEQVISDLLEQADSLAVKYTGPDWSKDEIHER